MKHYPLGGCLGSAKAVFRYFLNSDTIENSLLFKPLFQDLMPWKHLLGNFSRKFKLYEVHKCSTWQDEISFLFLYINISIWVNASFHPQILFLCIFTLYN